jgi:hypothetical protein
MNTSPQPDYLEFRIRPEDDGQEVPVDLVTQGLNGLQHLIHLFALVIEGKTVRQRARLTEEQRKKFVLRCKPPQSGSFIMPCRVGDPASDLYAPQQIANVTSLLQNFGRAAVARNSAELLRLVPDSRLRTRALGAFRDLAPPAGRGYRYEIQNCTGPAISLTEEFFAHVEELIRLPQDEERPSTVTGRLDQIVFSDRKLVIHYAPKSRQLDCLYSEDIEPMLFENRRDLIQVTGQVILDEDGHPKRITDVEQIQDLDLSPFALNQIDVSGFRLKFRSPLLLEPFLSESQQLICLEKEELDIDVFAATRAELWDGLRSQLAVLWREYALEADENLSAPALMLKARLHAAIEEARYAP